MLSHILWHGIHTTSVLNSFPVSISDVSSGVEQEDSPYTEQICKYCICQTEIIGMLQIMHIMLYILI